MHSISDLTTFCRKTTGDVPPKLVGTSTTVAGSKVYLFGGRLVTERRMVSDLYVFDLNTFVWRKTTPFKGDDVPEPRYFHSAEIWNNQLIIFGGMGNSPNSTNVEDLCVLNDVRILDLSNMRWLPASSTNGTLRDTGAEALTPKPRYAHLSSITADRMFIIGGQDLSNIWLDDIYVYDLLGKAWVQRKSFPHHCGTYRSVAVSANMRVRLPQNEMSGRETNDILGSPRSRLRPDKSPPAHDFTTSESLTHLPYSTTPTDDFPNDIYLYSNYNFTDVKRELQLFSPLPDTDFDVSDRSASMTGTSFPPGLRFPSGAILGTHLIIAGTYLAHTYQSYSIWALDLLSMTWSRIDPGNALGTGSWFRSCLWADASKFVIFGNRNGNLVEDYNRRLLSWDHVAVIDLESFGIYQPPNLRLDVPMQELGLSALEEGLLADFEIICDDGRKIKCSRKVLEDRWPWFKSQRLKFLERARQAIEALPSSPMDVGLPDIPGAPDASEARPDPRLTPRAFNLSEPYPITLALLQYFYSFALITPLQHAPAVLSQLLILSSTYQITHLELLVKHAMHRALSNSTSVGVYEVATLCNCRSLQIRALKTVMAYSQKRTGRSHGDGKSGGGPRNTELGDREAGRGSDDASGSPRRPRDTSDAKYPGAVEQQNMGSTGNGPVMSQTGIVSVDDQVAGSTSTASGPHTNPYSHKATSSQSTLTPPPRRRWISPRHAKALSIVSTHTDLELCAIADLLLPTVGHVRSLTEDHESAGVALDDGCDDYLDAEINTVIHGAGRSADISPLLLEHEEPLSPAFDTQFPNSPGGTHSESDADLSSDDINSIPFGHPYFNQLRRPRPRARANTGVSASDSDTPSLTSSTSFSSSSSATFFRFATLKTPSEDLMSHSHAHLAITEEPLSMCPERIAHRLSQNSGSIMFAPIDVPSDNEKSVGESISINTHKPSSSTSSSRYIEHLRVTVPSGVSTSRFSGSGFALQPPSLPPPLGSDFGLSCGGVSSTTATQSMPSANPRVGKLSLNRFVSTPSKSRKSTGSQESDTPSLSPTVSAMPRNPKEEAREAKLRKAEAKKMKKAEEKARMERLAEELKERQRRKTLSQDRRSTHSNKRWQGDHAMYEGLGAVF